MEAKENTTELRQPPQNDEEVLLCWDFAWTKFTSRVKRQEM